MIRIIFTFLFIFILELELCAQTAEETSICYGQPIKLSCNYTNLGGCFAPGSTYNWTNVSGSWTSSEINPVINIGRPGYNTDRFYLTVQYSYPPGGFSGGSFKLIIYSQIYPENTIVTSPTCYNGNNGSIVLTSIKGGLSPYTYLWSNGTTVQNPSNLSAGNYKVSITDNRGCSNIFTKSYAYDSSTICNSSSYLDSIYWKYTLSNPSSSMSLSLSSTNGNCTLSNCNSEITTSIIGGKTPYTYNWSGPNSYTSNSSSISSICSGQYTVTVTDSNSCSVTSSTVVGDFDIIEKQTNIRCNIPYSGAIYVSPTCTNYTYTYSWSNGKNTRIIYGLSSGVYTITVTNNYGRRVIKSYTIQ